MNKMIFVWRRWEIKESFLEINIKSQKIFLVNEQRSKETTLNIIKDIIKIEGKNIYLFLHKGVFKNEDKKLFNDIENVEVGSTGSDSVIDELRDAIEKHLKTIKGEAT